jgi:hypothetical protein
MDMEVVAQLIKYPICQRIAAKIMFSKIFHLVETDTEEWWRIWADNVCWGTNFLLFRRAIFFLTRINFSIVSLSASARFLLLLLAFPYSILLSYLLF